MKPCTYCRREVEDGAALCPHCGLTLRRDAAPRERVESGDHHDDRDWRSQLKVLYGCGALAAIVVMVPILLVVLAIARGQRADSAMAAPANEITMAKFHALKEGMTYADACGILGASGIERSRVSIAGNTTVMYMWRGPGISNMNAMFQNDGLVSKAQTGLR